MECEKTRHNLNSYLAKRRNIKCKALSFVFGLYQTWKEFKFISNKLIKGIQITKMGVQIRNQGLIPH